MRSMKYLVFRYADTNMERVFLFESSIEHKQFAALIPQEWELKAIRGGFVSIWASEGKVRVQCFGEAFSLGLSRDKETDEPLIHKQLVDE